MKTQTYLVATFKSIDDESEAIKGGLSYEEAKILFDELLKKNYGVEIIDEDPDNTEPIILIKTNSPNHKTKTNESKR